MGVGNFGEHHVEKYVNLEDAELVGVVDVVEDKAKKIAKRYKIQHFLKYEDIYDQVDAVSIAVPTRFHYHIAKNFLKEGKDVLLEKPITTTTEEATELIDIADANKRIFQVGHVERFNPAVMSLGKFLVHPRFIESHRLSSYKGRGIDVDVILDLMIHDIDIILSLVKRKVNFINAVGVPVLSPRIDIANARLQFDGGCTANITVSRISDKDMRKIRIFQPDAYFSLDYSKTEMAVYRRVRGEGELPEIIGNKKKMKKKNDSLQEEIGSFIHSVITRRPPVVSGTEGREALSVAMKIQEQIAKI